MYSVQLTILNKVVDNMKKILSILVAVVMTTALLVPMFQMTASANPFPGTAPINIVAIGGSLTEAGGHGWFGTNTNPGWFGQYLRAMFPGRTVNLHNAGIGGTGSNFGIFRLGRDVIAHNPDMVIIEFAINDRTSDPTSVQQYMEGMVRQLLALPNPPYIMFLLTMSEYSGANGIARAPHIAVAAEYNIPVIDLDAYFWTYHAALIPTWYPTADKIHPDQGGHDDWSRYIIARFEGLPRNADTLAAVTPAIRTAAAAANRDYFFRRPLSVPATPVFGREFHAPHLAAANTTATSRTGAWMFRNASNTPYDLRWFGDYLESTIEGSTLEFWITGRSFGLSYMIHPLGAPFTINVPGNPPMTPTPSQPYGNRLNTYFYDLGTDGWHRVTLTNTGGAGTILRIGDFFLERQTMPAPRITAVEFQDGGTTTSLTDTSIRLPEGAQTFNLIFSQPMDISSVTADRISIMRGNTAIPFTANYVATGSTVAAFDRTRLEITLNAPITNETIYTVRVNSNVTSLGVPMISDYVLQVQSTAMPVFLGVSFVNHLESEVANITAANFVTANITVENTQANMNNVTVVAVLERGNQILRFSRANVSTLRPGRIYRYTAGFNLPADRENLQLRVFVIDSAGNVISREVILQ